MNATKYIFVTGGVVSGLGKGITAASLGRLLKARGMKVTMQKLDPYINIDPGLMCPLQHGEVFVTDDGTETDLDLGHYERFIDERLNSNSSVTTGKVYWAVLGRERRGEYQGQTIQVIPHITDEIKKRICNAADLSGSDVNIVEIGGTVGDLESLPFLESIRQMVHDKGRENCLFIHVTFLPFVPGSDEYKTKPTQHSVKDLLGIGIQPDILVCRCDKPMQEEMRRKIALFCNVGPECVIDNVNVSTLYEAPLLLEQAGLAAITCKKLGLLSPAPDLDQWRNMVQAIHNSRDEVRIGLIGANVKLHDCYLSIAESLFHGGIANQVKVNIEWLDAQEIKQDQLQGLHGILIPGGDEDMQGCEGKLVAIEYARAQNIPLLAVGESLQIVVQNYHAADTGDTESVGAQDCVIEPGTKLHEAYGQAQINERFRTAFCLHPESCPNNMRISALSPNLGPKYARWVRAIELIDHPWFVAVQFHPEFKSRPTNPHPLFRAFVAAAKQK